MRSIVSIRIELTDDARTRLLRPVRGQGGFQSLLRELQSQVVGTNTLSLTPALVAKVARYVHQYGGGGFQGRLGPVLMELVTLARALEPMAA